MTGPRLSVLMSAAFIVGLFAGLWLSVAPAPPVDPSLADSLAGIRVEIAYLEEARSRAVSKSRDDSLALAALRRRVRVVSRGTLPANPDTMPANPGTTGADTVVVYEVPAPVAALVGALERRVVGLEAALDTTTLALAAAKRAGELSDAIGAQTLAALEAERRRTWRYRLEGAGVGGVVVAVAVIVLAL